MIRQRTELGTVKSKTLGKVTMLSAAEMVAKCWRN